MWQCFADVCGEVGCLALKMHNSHYGSDEKSGECEAGGMNTCLATEETAKIKMLKIRCQRKIWKNNLKKVSEKFGNIGKSALTLHTQNAMVPQLSGRAMD